MTAMSNEGFVRAVLAMGAADPFKPTAYYDADGDCIEFLASPDPFYAERIDDLVTVYYSQDTHEIVGSLIKGVSHFYKSVLEKFPGFLIELHDGRVQLKHLFRARLWAGTPDPADVRVIAYRKLIEVAERAEAEADLCVS